MNQKPVRKAVIAAAGFGTRFLPQTKAMPKEMLPLVDKPIIQYLVEELVEAGIEDIVIVTGYHKRSIEDHFDALSADLRSNLKQGGKDTLLQETKKISNLANFAYVRQKGPYGTATPLQNVAHLIGDEPFIYTYADDIFVAEPNHFKQMIDLYKELNCSVMSCINITRDEEYDRYGILAGDLLRPNVLKMSGIIEKPGKEQAPSNFGSAGGWLLTPDIFGYLQSGFENVPEGHEFYLTNYVVEPMLRDGKEFVGYVPQNSKYYDTGNKLDYLKTVIEFALQHDDISEEFKAYLRELSQR